MLCQNLSVFLWGSTEPFILDFPGINKPYSFMSGFRESDFGLSETFDFQKSFELPSFGTGLNLVNHNSGLINIKNK